MSLLKPRTCPHKVMSDGRSHQDREYRCLQMCSLPPRFAGKNMTSGCFSRLLRHPMFCYVGHYTVRYSYILHQPRSHSHTGVTRDKFPSADSRACLGPQEPRTSRSYCCGTNTQHHQRFCSATATNQTSSLTATLHTCCIPPWGCPPPHAP